MCTFARGFLFLLIAGFAMRTSSAGVDSQRKSSEVDYSQRDCVGPSPARVPVEVAPQLLDMCNSPLDALVLCVQLSRLSHEAVCGALNIDKGHFSRMLSGRANWDARRTAELMEFAGNLAPLQWMARRMGYELSPINGQQQERAAPWVRTA